MTIKLQLHHLQGIRTHAESTYPEECCGIVVGHSGDDGKTVVEIWATENAWSAEAADDFPEGEGEASKKRRYAIAPGDMLKAQRQARDRSLNIIGIYHSHPDNPAIPSEMDRAIAWPVYSYIIVSVPQSKAGELQSWCLDDSHQFQPEEIITEI
ncbi:M67 family metallopeptidase [Argonema antarcticum]|uniref:M67 family metallopeptidase n=1 Tax=Argonema antarcticum TaxID=2942763 RepID=UPI002013AE0D|nr:M67 family metallopeptidase [Argonema antarcticum A004/B2]